MVDLYGQVGRRILQDGGFSILRLDKSGALVTQDTHGKFYEAVKRGNAYYLAINTAAPTAYAGAAAGTPLIALYNPLNSGKDLSILQAAIGIGSSGTTIALVLFEYWLASLSLQGGIIGTGTQTKPINMYSQTTGGSVAYGFLNVALTGQTGTLNLLKPIVGGGANPGTTAPNTTSNGLDNPDGSIVIAPGSLLAIGSRTTLAAGSVDAAIIWEEIDA